MFIWPILIIVIVYYFASNGKNGRIDFSNDNALEKLKLRYVNNEIDDETYIKMKSMLKK